VVGRTRRALLGAGALGALALAGCGDRDPKPPRGGDAAVLGGILATQRSLAGGWQHVDPAVAERARAHAAQLTAAGADAGGAVPAAVAQPVARVRSREDREALLEAERANARALLAALPRLRSPDARELAMSLYATSAQHASILLAGLGRDPLPDAFAGTL